MATDPLPPNEPVRIVMEGSPITRCQSRYAWNTWCVKPPHGPDDQWHTNGGAIHWHTDAEVQGTGEVVEPETAEWDWETDL